MAADLTAELLIGGVWTKAPVLEEDGFTITRLAQNRASAVSAALCRFTLRNPAGLYSDRNPRSPYYGKLGRNTQMRATVPDSTHLYLDGDAWATTPDHASLDITGDLDVRVDAQPDFWDTTDGLPLLDKWANTGNQRSWALYVDDTRRPRLRWSPDGTSAAMVTAVGTAPVPIPSDGRVRLRATLRPNVSGSYEVRFYTGDTLAGPWTQFGDTLTGPASAIYAGTAIVHVAITSAVAISPFIGRFHAAQIRSGIDGTIVANPVFSAQTPGVSSFADSAGRSWSFVAGAEIRDFDVRFHGEIARWPVKWNTSGRKITAPLEASGIKRRLSRPKAPLQSALYREATKATNLPLIVGYWPAEVGEEALSIGSGIGGPQMSATRGKVTFAADEPFPGSGPLPTLAAGGILKANIPSYTATGVISFRCLASVPTAGFLNGSPIAEVRQTNAGGITRWILRTNVSGNLQLQGLGPDGAVVQTSPFIGFNINGQRQMLGFEVETIGSDVHWAIFSRTVTPDLAVVEGGFDGTFTGAAVGRATGLTIGGDGDLVDGVLGHFMVGNSTSLADSFNAAMVGNNGELAGRRIVRLCEELGIPLVLVGDEDETTPMGPQRIAPVMDLLQTAADADGGQLGEARTSLALRYRTRVSVYNQTPKLTLTYGAAGESPELEPEDLADDVINDATVSRTGGSSAQVVDETSRLSVQDSPVGVGRYDVEETVEVATDDQLDDVAGWKVHLGTWDEYRYPKFEIDIRKLKQYGKTALAAAAAAVDGLDRLVILQPPDWLPPAPIDLLALGMVEKIQPGIRTITFNCDPAGPWDIAVVDGNQRVGAEGTKLAGALAAGALTFQTVGTSDWVTGDTATNPVDFPLDVTVGAERIRISAITGSGTQTWTVASGGRGLDGWTAAQPINSPVDVADIAVVPL